MLSLRIRALLRHVHSHEGADFTVIWDGLEGLKETKINKKFNEKVNLTTNL